MKKLQQIVLAIIIVSFTSCASYSNKISKGNQSKLTKTTIHKIEGVYEYEPFKSMGERGKNTYNIDNDVEQLDFYILGTRMPLNPAKHTVTVKVISKDKVSFTFKRENKFVFERTIKMKLKSNGFLHLKNRHVKVKGIPLLVGGIMSDKMRIGISEDNDLLLNYAYDNFGSLIFMTAGNSYNRTHFYKKINALP